MQDTRASRCERQAVHKGFPTWESFRVVVALVAHDVGSTVSAELIIASRISLHYEEEAMFRLVWIVMPAQNTSEHLAF